MTEVAFSKNSQLMSTDICGKTFESPGRFPPKTLKSSKNRWCDAFKQAEAALSTLKD